MYVNFKNFGKRCKIWGFRAKNPVFRSKSLEKFGKKLVKVRKFRKKFGNSGNWFFLMFGNFGNLEIPIFPKTSKKWRPIQTSEITKYSFRLGNRPESSVKSSECRALVQAVAHHYHESCHMHSFRGPIQQKNHLPFHFCRIYLLYWIGLML